MNGQGPYQARDLPWLFGVVATQFALSHATLQYFSAIGMATAIVRPTMGFALGVMLVGGSRFWPAIFVATFASRWLLGYSLADAALIAGGLSLGAIFGSWLLTRTETFDLDIPSFRDFVRLIVFAGLFGASIGTVSGGLALYEHGRVEGESPGQLLLRWWMGDSMGILLFAPLVLVWRRLPMYWLREGRLLEAVAFFLCAFLAGQTIFLGWFRDLFGSIALGYWMFLFIVWGAARLGPHSVVLVLIMVLVQSLAGAAHGVGFFGTDIAKSRLANVWFYMLALSTVGMGLAATVTAFKRVEREVLDLAHHDPLTGLANRLLLTDRIAQAVAIARREHHRMALIFHDLDKFKPVNDQFGHRVGDLLLKEVAARVQRSVRESDTVGRIGGDEFVIVLPALDDVGDAVRVAEKIHHALLEPFAIDGHEIAISTSIGIAVFPENGSEEHELMVNADNAMYAAKQRGRNTICIFEPEMAASGGVRAGREGDEPAYGTP